MAKNPQPAAGKPEPPTSFEADMERLEAVVEEMESDQIPLETLLARYEEGMKLVGLCSEKLQQAEKRIQIIAKKEGGAPALEPFGEAPENGRPSGGSPAGDEPSLF
jgi:exodeoxyribonuclease VII small subunit